MKRDALRKTPTEKAFTSQVIRLANLRGWRVLHIRPARTKDGWRTPVQGDGVGFPDLLMVRGDTALAAELKVGKNKPTPAQMGWLHALEDACVAVYLWTPESWKEIEEILA